MSIIPDAGSPIYNSDGTRKSDRIFISDIIHELLHTLRMPHPFEETISQDTELQKAVGKNNYSSTSNTDSNIPIVIF